MATDAVRHRTRVTSAGRQAKERRERIALVVGLLILAGLLALEGPKTLKRLQSPGTTAPTAAPTAAAPPTSSAAQPTREVDLAALRGFAEKDPFVPQVGASAVSAQGPTAPAPPAVRTSDFVAKDPFVPQLSANLASTPGGTSTAGASALRGGYIVMLASVYVGRGRATAEKAAAAARAHHVPDVRIVLSSDYPTLRTGFYAVYSGPYPTLAKALTMLGAIRGRGYVSAYTRLLAH